jgi:hypothetical protein
MPFFQFNKNNKVEGNDAASLSLDSCFWGKTMAISDTWVFLRQDLAI